jgi:hypothetical protein
MAIRQKAAQRLNDADPRTPNLPAGDAKALEEEIQLRAYDRFCERGCAPGAELDDRLAAERDVSARQAARSSSPAPASGHARNRPR